MTIIVTGHGRLQATDISLLLPNYYAKTTAGIVQD